MVILTTLSAEQDQRVSASSGKPTISAYGLSSANRAGIRHYCVDGAIVKALADERPLCKVRAPSVRSPYVLQSRS